VFANKIHSQEQGQQQQEQQQHRQQQQQQQQQRTANERMHLKITFEMKHTQIYTN